METPATLEKKALFGKDWDLVLGLTYYPKKNIQFTASILDVGFIKHSKDVETLLIRGIINMRV
jgi:hypothetical protein